MTVSSDEFSPSSTLGDPVIPVEVVDLTGLGDSYEEIREQLKSLLEEFQVERVNNQPERGVLVGTVERIDEVRQLQAAQIADLRQQREASNVLASLQERHLQELRTQINAMAPADAAMVVTEAASAPAPPALPAPAPAPATSGQTDTC